MNSVYKVCICCYLMTASILGTGQSIIITDQIGTIFELDVSTCQATLLASIEDEITDISYMPDGRLIGINGRGEVFLIDLENQSTTGLFIFFSFNNNFFNSLTVSSRGLIFAMGTDGVLWSFNLQSLTLTEYGSIPFLATGDLTFFKGELYVAAGLNKVVKVNIDNPEQSTIVVESSEIDAIFGIVTETKDCENPVTYAISSDGLSSSLLQLDLENNDLDIICDIGFEVYGGASLDEFKASNPISIETTNVIQPTCTNPFGRARIIAYGGFGTLRYSIDSINFGLNSIFSELSAGTYTSYVRDSNGCVVTQDFEVLDVDELSFSLFEIGNARCDGRFGTLDVALTGSGTMTGSGSGISGCTFLIFENVEYDNNISVELSAGTYSITLANILGETRDTTIVIPRDNCNVYIPNAIYTQSANNNNQFEIFAEDGKPFTLVNYDIYDEWGNLVYEQDNFTNSESNFWWKGECLASECESDVFSYRIDVDFGEGEVQQYTGTVMLFK